MSRTSYIIAQRIHMCDMPQKQWVIYTCIYVPWMILCVLQPVPRKMRLEMVIGMQNEILNGIMKLFFEVSFQLKNWKQT